MESDGLFRERFQRTPAIFEFGLTPLTILVADHPSALRPRDSYHKTGQSGSDPLALAPSPANEGGKRKAAPIFRSKRL
jgi:hypothetical protein